MCCFIVGLFDDEGNGRDGTLFPKSLGGLGPAYFWGVGPWIVQSFDDGASAGNQLFFRLPTWCLYNSMCFV
jgi:hypothetical protein